MLASREPLPAELDEILFGDDAETDAFVYSLYADLCAGRVGTEALSSVLEQAAVIEEEVRSCCTWLRGSPSAITAGASSSISIACRRSTI